ncbi:extracellular catalytic domain type 1 short-chain-length polyhydroxyalkanoate depolymerase [Ferrimonas marina]|uniref:Esterase, PHB depolymerase family n=1 Tax=Ferrimonas marina TaxID=299255 RepID=A0A1M5QWH5_9GAMM|nr:PHB depolymerase family esterase [Ferrimonas marina]SHH18527.1 esterase, PHB depolymerase family [Ferrimonas marina]
MRCIPLLWLATSAVVSAEPSNPGNLSFHHYQPTQAKATVVVLHGCGQQAQSFARDSGWRDLAQSQGLALLLPQQEPENNAKRCFNWFLPSDAELTSLRQAIDQLPADQPVYLAGLSAGAAMAERLYLSEPQRFAGLALVAGIPAGCASNLTQALTCMQGQRTAPERDRIGADIPVVLAHDPADPLVAFSNSQWWQAHWQQDGGSVTLIELEGVGHAWPIDQQKRGQVGDYVVASQWDLTGLIAAHWFGESP